MKAKSNNTWNDIKNLKKYNIQLEIKKKFTCSAFYT